MDVARLNFSYGAREDHERAIASIRAIARKLGRTIGILQDLAGFKLRVGDIPGGAVALRRRQEIVLSAARSPGPSAIPIPAADLPKARSAGERLLLADGKIELEVLDTTSTDIRCRVRAGGLLQSHQGLAAPDTALPMRAATKKDLADLRFGLEHSVDWVAMSFVRNAEDLRPLRRIMERHAPGAALMAKIERHEAIDNLDEIIEAADGIMVARGDLGIQLPFDRVPLLQKSIIARCNAAGKPVVTATQMLESMVSSSRPTRAEASDVANAVLDGTDAVMLSGETAVGRYPTEAVRVMSRICTRAEAAFDFEGMLIESSQWPCRTVTDAISQATVGLANDLDARAIVTATSSGHTALMVAMHRPEARIIAITPDVATQRRLTLSWGVRPLLAPRGRNTDQLIVNAVARARDLGLVANGDLVVVTAGVPAGMPGYTNLIKVEVVGRQGKP
jgi:pyruvate kinase